MRALAASVLALLLLVASTAASAQAPAEHVPGDAVFVFSGRGWGHGVGMSQYGAYGQAREGRTYDDILAYYYYGTKLGRAGKKDVRVLLAEGRQAVTVASTAPFIAVDATGATVKLRAGPLVLRPPLDLEVQGKEAPRAAKPPLLIRPGKAPLSLDGKPYRGRLEIALDKGFLRVVNHVGIEVYLQGVVAGEMPYTWPAEALKAQAVAARTYALRNLLKGKPFDLYSDVRSQVYGGIGYEKPSTTEAVRATAGQVVTFGGQLATTYYFSSSGGKTASAADVFGFSSPYLISRPDPWDRVSPHHRWGPILVGGRTLQAKLSLAGRALDALGTATPSGRLRSVTFETLGGPTTIPATLVRTSLGLRSTWLTVGVLRLDRPRVASLVYGTSRALAGLARSVEAPQLAASPNGTRWSPVGPVPRNADGTFSRMVKPTATTRYRIQSGDATSQALLLRVALRVHLARAAAPDILVGNVRPRIAAPVVHLERFRGSKWVHVAEVLGDGAGRFRVQARLVPGTYRARVSPAAGLEEGISAPLTVAS